MKNQTMYSNLLILLSLLCVVCKANEPIMHCSVEGRAFSLNQHHANLIQSYKKTNTIFTQKWHSNHQNTANSSSSAENRFLSFFTIINFANVMCTVGSTMGFCVTASECSNFGGSRIGDCAMGYGNCCYKAIKCGESSSMNVTYIQNADYPGSTSSSGSCSHSITRQDNVCKLRLDFVEFELSDPLAISGDAQNGMCLDDQMTVSGVASTQFKYLCGKMPPTWHFYLDVRDASSPTTFTFSLSSGVTKDRKWNIKVTQIDCDRKIPQGCGQYFTGTSGDPLYSFNWDNNGMYLYGMNYAICFRQEKGYCTHSFVDSGTSWVVCPDSLAFPSPDYLDVDPTAGAITRECNSLVTATAWPSSINTNNYSPTMIYHFTDQVNNARTVATPLNPANISPGFYFTWTHNKC